MLLSLFLALIGEPKVDVDVVYSKVAGEELKMDIHSPAAATSPLPATVVIHGGAWMSGNRKDMSGNANELAKRGIVAATISYRLAPKHKWPGMVDDVQTAVRFLRANAAKYNIDPTRIGATGASAGGHLALFLGVTDTLDKKATEYPGFSSKVKAVLNIFGPTDLTDRTDFPAPIAGMLSLQVFGKKLEEATELAKMASPIFLVTKDDAPVFILQGLTDKLVNPHQSRILEAKLKEVGVRCESAYVEDMGHEVPMEKPQVKAAMERAVAWFIAELKK